MGIYAKEDGKSEGKRLDFEVWEDLRQNNGIDRYQGYELNNHSWKSPLELEASQILFWFWRGSRSRHLLSLREKE